MMSQLSRLPPRHSSASRCRRWYVSLVSSGRASKSAAVTIEAGFYAPLIEKPSIRRDRHGDVLEELDRVEWVRPVPRQERIPRGSDQGRSAGFHAPHPLR